jgi:hypothetical protein
MPSFLRRYDNKVKSRKSEHSNPTELLKLILQNWVKPSAITNNDKNIKWYLCEWLSLKVKIKHNYLLKNRLTFSFFHFLVSLWSDICNLYWWNAPF